jgi:hypothetical protein
VTVTSLQLLSEHTHCSEPSVDSPVTHLLPSPNNSSKFPHSSSNTQTTTSTPEQQSHQTPATMKTTLTPTHHRHLPPFPPTHHNRPRRLLQPTPQTLRQLSLLRPLRSRESDSSQSKSSAPSLSQSSSPPPPRLPTISNSCIGRRDPTSPHVQRQTPQSRGVRPPVHLRRRRHGALV